MSASFIGILALVTALFFFIVGKLISNGWFIKNPIWLDVLGIRYRNRLPLWINILIGLLLLSCVLAFWIGKEMTFLGIILIFIGLIIGSWVGKYNFKPPGYRPPIFETELSGCFVVTLPFLFIILGIYILMTN